MASSGGSALELAKVDAFIAQELETHEPPLQHAPEELVDEPPALDPLAVDFARCPYTISECGQFEIIGDRRIRRRKGSQRAPGIFPEVWDVMSAEQRLSLRKRQEQQTTSAAAGAGDAPVARDASVQGGDDDALVPAAPALPLDPSADYNAHRPRIQEHWPLYNAAVARPIKNKELQENPKALTR